MHQLFLKLVLKDLKLAVLIRGKGQKLPSQFIDLSTYTFQFSVLTFQYSHQLHTYFAHIYFSLGCSIFIHTSNTLFTHGCSFRTYSGPIDAVLGHTQVQLMQFQDILRSISINYLQCRFSIGSMLDSFLISRATVFTAIDFIMINYLCNSQFTQHRTRASRQTPNHAK